MASFNFLLSQFKIKFVNVIKRHLMSVTSKNYQFLIKHYWTVAISCTRLFSNHKIWVIFQWCQKFRM